MLAPKPRWVDVKTEPKAESRGNNTAYADMEQSKILRHHRGNIKEFLAESRAGKSLYLLFQCSDAFQKDYERCKISKAWLG